MDEQNKNTTEPVGQPTEPPTTPSVEDLTKEIEALKAAMKKQKLALDTASSDAAEWKRQYRATLDETARKQAEQDELNAARDAKLAAYEHNDAVNSKVTKYLAMGYPEDLARQSAEAYVNGQDDVVLDLQKQFMTQFETQVKASLLSQQPKVTPGETPSGVGAESPEITAFKKGIRGL